jgi:hypothetical protein
MPCCPSTTPSKCSLSGLNLTPPAAAAQHLPPAPLTPSHSAPAARLSREPRSTLRSSAQLRQPQAHSHSSVCPSSPRGPCSLTSGQSGCSTTTTRGYSRDQGAVQGAAAAAQVMWTLPLTEAVLQAHCMAVSSATQTHVSGPCSRPSESM